jgi:glucose/arabinose dehydrogenase
MKLLTKRSLFIIGIVAVIAVVVLAALVWWNFQAQRAAPSPAATATGAPLATAVAQNLEIPWSLAFLPDGSIVVTERPGRVRLIDAQDGLLAEPLLTVDEVSHRGEGGLLGVTLHPDFTRNQFLYLYYTHQDGQSLTNRVVRFLKQGNTLVDGEIIIDGIPAAGIHNGGRIKFGPDGVWRKAWTLWPVKSCASMMMAQSRRIIPSLALPSIPTAIVTRRGWPGMRRGDYGPPSTVPAPPTNSI